MAQPSGVFALCKSADPKNKADRQVRERLEHAAQDESHALHAIATALKNAGCTSSVVEVSTLRGRRALDTRWRDDPTRRAIIGARST